jgi:hypothetical protein
VLDHPIFIDSNKLSQHFHTTLINKSYHLR